MIKTLIADDNKLKLSNAHKVIIIAMDFKLPTVWPIFLARIDWVIPISSGNKQNKTIMSDHKIACSPVNVCFSSICEI